MNDETDDDSYDTEFHSYNVAARVALAKAAKVAVEDIEIGSALSTQDKVSAIAFQIVYLAVVFLDQNGVSEKDIKKYINLYANHLLGQKISLDDRIKGGHNA